jgi:hypothetical protein
MGSLVEGWLGGEGPLVGVGKITNPGNPMGGILGFVGVGASAGPLAGIQIGYAAGSGWGGLYLEGHVGPVAVGGGGYANTSCNGGS